MYWWTFITQFRLREQINMYNRYDNILLLKVLINKAAENKFAYLNFCTDVKNVYGANFN